LVIIPQLRWESLQQFQGLVTLWRSVLSRCWLVFAWAARTGTARLFGSDFAFHGCCRRGCGRWPLQEAWGFPLATAFCGLWGWGSGFCAGHIACGFGIAILRLEALLVALPAWAEAFAASVTVIAIIAIVAIVVEIALLAIALRLAGVCALL